MEAASEVGNGLNSTTPTLVPLQSSIREDCWKTGQSADGLSRVLQLHLYWELSTIFACISILKSQYLHVFHTDNRVTPVAMAWPQTLWSDRLESCFSRSETGG